MQVFSRKVLVLALLLGCGSVAGAQKTAKPNSKSPVWKDYCHGRGSFCFKYPASWSLLGEVLGGNGVVVAPPQTGDRENWDEVTVAMVLPPPKGAADAITVDQLIDQAVSDVRASGQSFETLERQRRRVDGKPAQLLKLHYVEKGSSREWIEELIFVEGPDAEIYSVALKCAPSSMVRIEPVFSRLVNSWILPEEEPATGADVPKAPDASTPSEDSTPPKP